MRLVFIFRDFVFCSLLLLSSSSSFYINCGQVLTGCDYISAIISSNCFMVRKIIFPLLLNFGRSIPEHDDMVINFVASIPSRIAILRPPKINTGTVNVVFLYLHLEHGQANIIIIRRRRHHRGCDYVSAIISAVPFPNTMIW